MLRLFAGVLTLACLVAIPRGTLQAQTFGSELIPETLAMQHGLHRPWFTRLRIDGGSRVGSIVQQAGLLLSQSDHGAIQALDPETGRTLWVTHVGRPNYPTLPAAANAQYVAVSNGTHLYLLSRTDGQLVWDRDMKGFPSAGPGMSASRVYVAMLNGSVHSYNIADKNAVDRDPVLFFGTGRSEAAPVVSETHMMWGTNTGNVYCDGLQSSVNRFLFKAHGPVTATLVHRPPLLYVTSQDGYVYALNDENGASLWQFSAGSPLLKPAATIRDAVYVTPDSGGMSRLSVTSGVEQWFAAGITQFVAASPTRVYGTDVGGGLIILNAQTGARLGSLPTGQLPIKLINLQTDRIYLASASGLLQCLRERELVKPEDYAPKPVEKDKKTGPAKKTEQAPAEGTEGTPATPPAEPVKNPFG
jgi:outer membrane protein assembly factor BamB